MDIFQEDTIDCTEAAALKGMIEPTFRWWVWKDRGPPSEKKKGRLYFKRQDVIDWSPQRKRKPKGENNG